MKFILNLSIIIMISLFSTGCLSAKYNKDYISKQLKPELKKVDKNICINDSSLIEEETHSITFSLHETNSEVSKNYFKQYFNDVNNPNKECFIRINTEVSNIESKMISPDGMDARFNFSLSAYQNNKLLFDMNTEEEYSSEVFITFALLGLSAPYKTANEAFHKGLFEIYETKVEKNLLKSLR